MLQTFKAGCEILIWSDWYHVTHGGLHTQMGVSEIAPYTWYSSEVLNRTNRATKKSLNLLLCLKDPMMVTGLKNTT
jgi:hypothetical protein